ncbi:uncharacterized protein LOC116926581 [Daphnia magna]|uniref:DNA-directed RNA polymerase I subunit RPA34 n=1 Tax=Daphnia magna TaxID=35525 RepID=A0ABR0AL08_9CRUS|nr:uncharacterized protein LOC116926581 [Daphnia magna]KAK4025801.1 hypothetical protein OUZ56_014847 [Daphnia magna]
MSSSESESSNDENSAEIVSVNSSFNSNFKNDVELEAGLVPLKMCPALLTAEELASDDYDCWMVTLPGTLDAEKLCNLELSLSKSTKFKIEKEKCEAIVQQKSDINTFVLPDKNGKIKFVARETVGTISVVKNVSLKTKNIQTTDFQTKKIIDLPQGLKRRHPIYGKDLEGIMCQSSGLMKPKEEMPENIQHTVKEKKKRKRTN